MRARLMAAFDHFHDVASHSDDRVSQLIRELKVDIAVDLKGHTRDARPMILAKRPAPIQISYLGYPGTTGEGSGIDYILADSTVLPLEEQTHYSEKILHLPGCYQANDSKGWSARPLRAPAKICRKRASYFAVLTTIGR